MCMCDKEEITLSVWIGGDGTIVCCVVVSVYVPVKWCMFSVCPPGGGNRQPAVEFWQFQLTTPQLGLSLSKCHSIQTLQNPVKQALHIINPFAGISHVYNSFNTKLHIQDTSRYQKCLFLWLPHRPPSAWTLHPPAASTAPIKVETVEKKIPKGVPLQFDINSVGKPVSICYFMFLYRPKTQR